MIVIGSDHAGYALKCEILKYFETSGIEYKDMGCNGERADYPVIAEAVCKEIVEKKTCDKGILVCGTGIGMSMAANKIHGIRAAVCSDWYSVKYTRLHNNANVLCMGGRVIGAGTAEELVKVFLETEFEGGRHQARIDLIHKLEK